MNSNAFKRFDLSGRTAVVTAGGTGLGYYLTRGLVRSGARVLIASRREDVLKESARRIAAESGAEVLHHTVDLNDRDSIEAFNRDVLKTLGHVDIFVGNAAVQDLFEPIDTVTNRAIDAQWQVNVSSIVEMMRAFLPGMRRNRWGRIIMSSSVASLAAPPAEHETIYAATKAAVNSIARSVACEVGRDGITANAMVFGIYETDMLASHLSMLEKEHGKEAVQAFRDGWVSMIPPGRMGQPEEVEGLIQFLASDAASYINGTNLVADGGFSIQLRPQTPPANAVYPPKF